MIYNNTNIHIYIINKHKDLYKNLLEQITINSTNFVLIWFYFTSNLIGIQIIIDQ